MTQPLVEQAKKIIESISLPSPPQILFDITAEMAKKEPEYSSIIDLVSQDMAMTAKIIKVANSPFFGLRYKAATIETALSVLGLENFKSIVLATSLRDAMKGNNLTPKEFEAFYTHSMRVGRIAQLVIQTLGATELYASQVFMAGLFHDCGIPMLSQKFPKYMKTIRPHVMGGEDIVDVEEAFFLTNHCIVGSFVAKAWQIPDMVCQAIETHHDKTINPGLKEHEKQIQAIILLSEYMLHEALDDDERKAHIYHNRVSAKVMREAIIPLLNINQRDYTSLMDAVDELIKVT